MSALRRLVAAASVSLALPGNRTSAQPAPSGLTPQVLTFGADTMRIVRTPQGVPTGSVITDVRREGQSVIRMAFVYDVPGSVHATTVTRLRRSDLRPLEQTHNFGGGDSARVVFGADQALATLWSPTRPTTTEATSLPAGAVTSAAIDLVLRTLPLARGFSTELPVYFMPLHRVIGMPVRVSGVEVLRTTKGRQTGCWVVEAEFPGPAIERFWIAQKTRELVRVEGHLSPTVIERFER
jgi:hypothetical protein